MKRVLPAIGVAAGLVAGSAANATTNPPLNVSGVKLNVSGVKQGVDTRVTTPTQQFKDMINEITREFNNRWRVAEYLKFPPLSPYRESPFVKGPSGGYSKGGFAKFNYPQMRHHHHRKMGHVETIFNLFKPS